MAISFIPGIGLYDFFSRGEGREALIVQDIVSHGDWLLPRGYDNTISTKPPLFHWTAAAFASLIGLSEFSIRLPSAVFAFLGLLIFLSLLRNDLNEKGKWIFLIVLSFSVEWLRAGLTARVDMVHAASLSCGMLAGYYALMHKKFYLWLATSVLLGLGMLGKGPVAIVLGSGVLYLWALLHFKRKIYPLVCVTGVALCSLLIGSAWFIAAYFEAPREFWEFFHYETFARFTSTMEDAPHSHSVFYLAAVFFIGLLPFSPYVLWRLYRNVPRKISELKSGFKNMNPLFVFSMIVVATVFVFYSIPTSKRSVYLLACYPFAALAIAIWLQDKFNQNHIHKLKNIGIFACILVFIIQAIVLPFAVESKQSERKISQKILQHLTTNESIFGYGAQFYGASFYSKLLFYDLRTGKEAAIFKLKEQLELQPKIKVADLLLAFEKDFDSAQKEVGKLGLNLSILESLKLGRKTVFIARVANN